MTTWFVRHSTAHGATPDGASYATAWGTFSEVVWGGAGVVAGDTLYVCGAHTTKLTIGANGNASNRIAVDFRYSADPGSIDGGGAVSPLITANIRRYFDIIGPTLTDPTSGTTASHIYMDRCRHITVSDAVINGVTANVARGIVIRSGNTTSGNYGTFDVEVSGCAISDLNGGGDILLLVGSRADARLDHETKNASTSDRSSHCLDANIRAISLPQMPQMLTTSQSVVKMVSYRKGGRGRDKSSRLVL